MRKDDHYVGQVEEVMAYLDGELSLDRAQVVATHLQDCEKCQSIADDLRNVCEEMHAWQLEPADVAMSSELAAALEQQEIAAQDQRERRWLPWLKRPQGRLPWTLVYGSAVLAVVVLFAALWTPHLAKGPVQSAARTAESNMQFSRAPEQGRIASEAVLPPAPVASAGADRDRLAPPTHSISVEVSRALAFDSANAAPSAAQGQSVAAVTRTPMIVHTAQLTVVASDFDSARASMDDILKRHGGYVSEMTTTAPEQGERELTARLHIPAPQLDAALTEFKKLGRVEHESQNGEEVTSQFVDLEARLGNARNSEQRLTELLRNRTGKLDDVLQVEEKISETRGDIERMEAQRKSLLTSVDFATLSITLKQERKAQLQVSPPSIGTRFHNAAVDGFTALADGVIGFLEVLLSIGPSLLLWGAVLFFPARWAWRRRHRVAS